jgi:hypothetical protein
VSGDARDVETPRGRSVDRNIHLSEAARRRRFHRSDDFRKLLLMSFHRPLPRITIAIPRPAEVLLVAANAHQERGTSRLRAAPH